MINGPALIRERRLFQQWGKHREQICTPRTVLWTRFQEFPYIKTTETHELVVVFFVKQCGFGFHTSLYQAP